MGTEKRVQPTLLTLPLLERLKAGWERAGAPLVECLAPGLSGREIDGCTAPLGFRLPVEARTWWEWHDGLSVPNGPALFLGPGLPFLSLAQAVELCLLQREVAERTWTDDPEAWWRSSWFPITDRNGPVRCDCSVEEGSASPVYQADSHDYEPRNLTEPQAPSFGTMVEWWIQALNSGAWSYIEEEGRWERDLDRLPVELLASRLV